MTNGELAAFASENEGGGPLHPLLTQREVKKVTLLVVAANRGLCGGYNGNVLRATRSSE